MRFITLDENNIITSIRIGKEIVEGEIQSDIGEIGQIMQPDGTFIDAPVEHIEPQATIEEQIFAENQYQTALLEMQQMLGGE